MFTKINEAISLYLGIRFLFGKIKLEFKVTLIARLDMDTCNMWLTKIARIFSSLIRSFLVQKES
jgi:hypothetical protein